ncbi:Uncharacterised protein [Yersinia frederiksenii]|jgi:hypothetical protein|uniref:Uncharacterized protein n=1 Tax=Yersinia frederiksenii TaxID=29484 RepID=A0AAI8ZV19_YERFR|nr:Uncharacterised protein [Yersinia frederiksenii]CFR31711.1 Uncharacterised protein [Yersinia frederiksenii]CNG88035.1 Uncharacterised protein [Yersinia frederiksenii]CNM02210.1 Uncharacterised protein [Yersinia frederiksenii]CQH60813.1 Uncharacterised protein [Yersinia frederiksenii]
MKFSALTFAQPFYSFNVTRQNHSKNRGIVLYSLAASCHTATYSASMASIHGTRTYGKITAYASDARQ